VFPVRYKLGFYVPEDDILHSHCCENFKSYTSTTFFLAVRIVSSHYISPFILSSNRCLITLDNSLLSHLDACLFLTVLLEGIQLRQKSDYSLLHDYRANSAEVFPACRAESSYIHIYIYTQICIYIYYIPWI
jgi:hypothetical protein